MPKQTSTRWRGFASMTPAEQKETAQMGGHAVVKRYGKKHMREIAQIAVKKRRKLARARAAYGSKV